MITALEEYETLEETAYLLRSPKNLNGLMESVSQLENDEGSSRKLIE